MKKTTNEKLALNVRRTRVNIRTSVNTGLYPPPKSRNPACDDIRTLSVSCTTAQ